MRTVRGRKLKAEVERIAGRAVSGEAGGWNIGTTHCDGGAPPW